MTEQATATYEKKIKKLGDEIAGLTLKEAVNLTDYMKDEYQIEPAAGGAVMMAAGAGTAEAPVEEETTPRDQSPRVVAAEAALLDEALSALAVAARATAREARLLCERPELAEAFTSTSTSTSTDRVMRRQLEPAAHSPLAVGSIATT